MEKKLPPKELIIAAFCGGTVTSLFELANMLSSHENIIDIYFWAGALIAGIIGVLGLFVSQAKDIGGAITSGVAAPQLLGGMAKITPTVISLLLSPIITPIYAGEEKIDSVEITTIVEKGKIYEIKPLRDTGKTILIRDTMTFMVPKGDMVLYKNGVKKAQFKINTDTTHTEETIIKINTTTQTKKPDDHKKPTFRLLRGVFGHVFRKETITEKKVEINIEQKPITE